MRSAIFALAALCPAALLPADVPRILNGSMDDGAGTPLHWQCTENVRMRRDTKVFRSAPASLALTSDGKDGNANQRITGLAGATVVFAGHVRREASLDNVQIFTLTFDRNWKSLGWKTLLTVPAGDEWRKFEATASFPPETGTVLFGIFCSGTGTAWLDDVSLAEADPAEARRRRMADFVASLPVYDLSRYAGPRPKLLHIGAVAPDILCLHVREKEIKWGAYEPYRRQDGDEIVEKGHQRALRRGGREAGWIGGPPDRLYLRAPDTIAGQPLQVKAVHDPASWSIAGEDAPKAVAVGRKAKPHGYATSGPYGKEHFVFLQLSAPLAAGKTYRISAPAVNLDPPVIEYAHDPRTVRSEAVHVSHVGFRPDDPAKVAYLSIWLGSAGPYTGYREGMPFHLLDVSTGRPAYSGKTRLHMRHTQPAHGLHAKGRNFPNTDVYAMDFSDFRTPGTYVVSVDGIGCSYPFPIAADVWERALRTNLRGFFHQRSGLAFGPPSADYERPRCFHPDDGNVFYEMTISELEFSTTLGDGKLEELLKFKTDRTVAGAWGGTHDAGDYDRRAKHLLCSRFMLELLELYSGYFAALKLPIPEKDNDRPDILDEALWNLDLYRRIQREDGAVRGGIETNGHPQRGECSFTDSLTRLVFAPDVRASWIYAGVAAQAAWWFQGAGRDADAAAYRDSALRAMRWAESEYAANAARYHQMKDWWHVKDERNLAALQLYRLTRDPHWHKVFLETCGFKDTPGLFRWGKYIQNDAAFLYARMDEKLTDPAVRDMAVRGLRHEADFQIDYAGRQAFEWTARDLGAPIINSALATPMGQPLCRAHYITGDPKYLEWAVRTTQHCLGANPLNMTYTTGLGHRRPEYPLFVDYHVMGLPKAPAGLTLYGIVDPLFSTWDWGWTWITGKHMEPKIDHWPLLEIYCDVYHWPAVNEYTVVESLAPALYVWGYLSARK